VLVCHHIDLPDDDEVIEAGTYRRDVTNNYVLLTVQFVEPNTVSSTANFRNFPVFSSFADIPAPSLSFVRLVYINFAIFSFLSFRLRSIFTFTYVSLS
jgi:hypothetical protein